MQKLSFGAFELDPAVGELRRRGRPVPLGPQPLRLLALLTARPGHLVTREEIQQQLWADGTSVDFEHGVNACVRQVRVALGDRADKPRYVETVPRRGYRFVAPVQRGWSRPPTRPPGHVVGRAEPLRALAAVYERVIADRRGRVVCLAGEPGIGKTTLASLFVTQTAGHPSTPAIGRGRCSERLAGTAAYLPWLEALDDLVATGSGHDREAMLREMAPTWHRLIAQSHQEAGEASAAEALHSPEQLKRELASWLVRQTASQPLVLWLEDLHWADASTVDLIAYIASRFDDLAMLILVTFRETELKLSRHPFAALRLELESRGQCQAVPLTFLEREDVQTYLAEKFAGHDFPPQLATLLHARTEGSPLFVADAVSYLCARDAIALDHGRWIVRGTLPDLDRDLPPSILAMIERKLGLITDAADVDVLQAASLIGHDFDSAIVSDVVGRDPADVEASLGRLARVHAVVAIGGERRLPDGSPTLDCRFVHVLYQNALTAQIPPTRRARLCRTSADAILRRHDDQSEAAAPILARLYDEAGDASRAAAFSIVAARRALTLFANHEVVLLAESGLGLLPRITDAREREVRELELRLTLAPALTALQGWAAETLRENYARAQVLCERAANPRDVLLPLMGLATFHHVRANFAESGRLARQVRSLAEQGDDPVLLSMALGNLAAGAFHLARLAESRALLTRVLDQYAPASQRDLLVARAGMDSVAVGAAYLACVDLIENNPDGAAANLERATELAGSHPFTRAVVPAFGAIIAFSFDRPDEVRRHAQGTIRLSAEHGFAGQSAFGGFFLGWATAVEDNFDEGLAMMDETERVLVVVGNDVFRSVRQLALAEAHFRKERFEAARLALQHMSAFIERTGERIFEPELYRLRGRIAEGEGDAAAARSEFTRAQATAQHLGTSLFEARAEAALVQLQTP